MLFISFNDRIIGELWTKFCILTSSQKQNFVYLHLVGSNWSEPNRDDQECAG